MSDYWRIFAEEVPADMGLSLTQEQIDHLTERLIGAHENFSTAHGHDCIPNPLLLEIERLKRDLAMERQKEFCVLCYGTGRLKSNFGYYQVNTECYECRGIGRK